MQFQEPFWGEALDTNTMQGYTSDDNLSLCDLPLHNTESHVDHEDIGLSSESSMSSQLYDDDDDDDYFEFFSPSSTTTTTPGFPPESIVFCGRRLIRREQPVNYPQEDALEVKKEERHHWGLTKWRFSGWRSTAKKTPTLDPKKGSHNSLRSSVKNVYGNNKKPRLPVHNMSIIASSPSGKKRWCLMLLGISRNPTELDLKSIKNRQSRRHLQPSPSKLLQDRNVDNRMNNKGSSGLWGIIRVLSCGGNQHPNTMFIEPIKHSPRK